MEQLKSIDNINNLYAAMGLLVPGLIILFVRSQFVTGRMPSHSAMLLSYLAVSLVYYALSFLLLDPIQRLSEREYGREVIWSILIFIGPALIGLLLGINIRKNLLHRFLQRCGLNLVHPITTAWDWKFGNMTEQWVLVTLKDDTRFVGFCGQSSFISSDPTNRDIYIEQIYDIDNTGSWSSPGPKGVLIAPGEVKTIEFWPYTPEDDADEQV